MQSSGISPDEIDFDSPDAGELTRDDLWWEIYRDSFPPNEQEPVPVIVDGLLSHVGLAFRARRRQSTMGIATTHLLHNPAAVFLVYLAIQRGNRDAGLGGRLMDYAWTVSRTRLRESGLDAVGMVWEVEAPQLAADPAEEILRERRLSFFRRHDGVLLPGNYVQPPVNGVAPVPMRLMFRSPGTLPDEATMPDEVTMDALVRAIYFEKYGNLNKIPAEILTHLLSTGRIP